LTRTLGLLTSGTEILPRERGSRADEKRRGSARSSGRSDDARRANARLPADPAHHHEARRDAVGYREIVTRQPDKSFHHYTYADFSSRAKKLSVALKKLGVESGERVGTLAPNTYQHLEAYRGIPCSSAVLHTINPRLHEDDLAYIVNHARDKVLMVDGTLVEVLESFREQIHVEHVVVFDRDTGDLPDNALSYEDLLADADEGGFNYPEFDEKQAAAM